MFGEEALVLATTLSGHPLHSVPAIWLRRLLRLSTQPVEPNLVWSNKYYRSEVREGVVNGQTTRLIRLSDRRFGSYMDVAPDMGNRLVDLYLGNVQRHLLNEKGMPILWPFANRVKNGVWNRAKNRPIDLRDLIDRQLISENDGHAIHGVARHLPWRIESTGANGEGIYLTSSLTLTREDPATRLAAKRLGSSRLDVSYRLKSNVLSVRVQITNLGSKPLRQSLGFHPWFRMPADLKATMRTGARKIWRGLIPSGPAEVLSIDDDPNHRLEQGVAVDDVYTDLERNVNHEAEAYVEIPTWNVRIRVRMGELFKHVVIYLDRYPGHEAICIEPQSSATDFLNLLWAKVPGTTPIRLGPGRTVSSEFTISAEPYQQPTEREKRLARWSAKTFLHRDRLEDLRQYSGDELAAGVSAYLSADAGPAEDLKDHGDAHSSEPSHQITVEELLELWPSLTENQQDVFLGQIKKLDSFDDHLQVLRKQPSYEGVAEEILLLLDVEWVASAPSERTQTVVSEPESAAFLQLTGWAFIGIAAICYGALKIDSPDNLELSIGTTAASSLLGLMALLAASRAWLNLVDKLIGNSRFHSWVSDVFAFGWLALGLMFGGTLGLIVTQPWDGRHALGFSFVSLTLMATVIYSVAMMLRTLVNPHIEKALQKSA